MSKVSPHFKPASSALLLIDYQVGTMQLIRNQMPDTSLRNAIALAKTALAFSMPIVLTSSQEDHLQGPIAESLQHVVPEQFAARIQRVGVVNAWDDPGFKKAVEATGRRQLIMGAVTTDICLVFPAISAVEDGYEVQAVMDASGSSFAIGEETSRRRMERSGVWLTSTNTMIAELVQDWSTTEGQKLMPLMMADVAIHPVD
jgi:nicotinamidase-related amidase